LAPQHQATDVPMGDDDPLDVGGETYSGSAANPAVTPPYPQAGSSSDEKATEGMPAATVAEPLTRSQVGVGNQIVKFKRAQAASSMVLPQERPQTMELFATAQVGSTCIDQAAQALVFCYLLRVAELVKWRSNWDCMSELQLHNRATNKGHHREGPGKGQAWDYMTYVSAGQDPPPYAPDDDRLAPVDMQIAQLVNFCRDRCGIPESFWRSESAEGTALKRADNFLMNGNVRSHVLMKAIRAMYRKPKCSFVHGPNPREDVYYFPEGAAFTNEKKPNPWMAASVLTLQLDAKMGPVMRSKGIEYLNSGLAITNAPNVRGERSEPNPEKGKKKQQVLPPPFGSRPSSVSSASSRGTAAVSSSAPAAKAAKASSAGASSSSPAAPKGKEKGKGKGKWQPKAWWPDVD
jgi:hypothetical protein